MRFNSKFLLPIMLSHAIKGYGVDWLFEPEFTSSERYDDNVTMQAKKSNQFDSLITTLSPGVMLGYQVANSDLKTRFKWNELIYHSAPSLDFSEKLLSINHQYQSDFFKTGLSANYNEQSAINTQLDENGSGNLQSKRFPTTNRSISPNILFFLSERNSLQLAYSYQDVSFEKPPGVDNVGYSDYNVQQYSATAYHNYSERLTLNLTGAYSVFESSGDTLVDFSIIPDALTQHFSQKSTTIFYQAGMQYAFDELTQISLAAGMRDSQNDTSQYFTVTDTGQPFNVPPYIATSNTGNASGHVFSANLNRKGEWGSFSLNAGQQLNPSSTGTQQQSTSFSGQARFDISSRWNAGLNVSRLITESTSTFSNSSIANNRVYTTITPNIQWRWTPEINLQLSYTHREQDLTDFNQIAIGNSAQLMFSYQPQINRQVK